MPHLTHEELLKKIDQGMHRAALRAREIALQTNTPIVIHVDGKVQEVWMTEQAIAEYREQYKDKL